VVIINRKLKKIIEEGTGLSHKYSVVVNQAMIGGMIKQVL
jgi:hypothetical protein